MHSPIYAGVHEPVRLDSAIPFILACALFIADVILGVAFRQLVCLGLGTVLVRIEIVGSEQSWISH